jgi:nicotinamidase-related amidase
MPDPLDRTDTALIVVDIQGNLAMAMSGREALFDSVARLVDGAKLLGLPILWAEQVPEKLGPTIADIARRLADVTAPIAKCAFSCMSDPVFAEALVATGKRRFLLCGVETHICVFQTAAQLLSRGYVVHVVADAVSSRTADNKKIGLDRIAAMGGTITGVEMALFELSGAAGGDEFRALVKIVK